MQFVWRHRLYRQGRIYDSKGREIVVQSAGFPSADHPSVFDGVVIKVDNKSYCGKAFFGFIPSKTINELFVLNIAYGKGKNLQSEEFDVTLDFSRIVAPEVWQKIQWLLTHKKGLPCVSQLKNVSKLELLNLQDRMVVLRYERKVLLLEEKLKKFDDKWKQLAFYQLAKSLGANKNRLAFERIGTNLSVELLHESRIDLIALEGVLFGAGGLLSPYHKGVYPQNLRVGFEKKAKDYNVRNLSPSIWNWRNLKNIDAPTYQMAILAFFVRNSDVFLKMIYKAVSYRDFQNVVGDFRLSKYWCDHYVFDQISTGMSPKIPLEVIQRVYINALLPLQMLYKKRNGVSNFLNRIDELFGIPAEKNHVVKFWNNNGVTCRTSFESQAMLELYNNYCSQKKCLNCSIGLKTIK